MQPLISILTFYNWDNSIFDGLIPPGPQFEDDKLIAPAVDKQRIIDYIIAECAELNLLYTDFDYLKNLISTWSAINLHGWERMQRTLWDDYNPLHNFDRIEEYEDERTPDIENIHTDINPNAQISKHYESGMTSGEQVQASEDRISYDSETTDKQTGTEKNKHTGHLRGNIGLTKSQEMATDEINLRKKYNIEKIIAMQFRDEFCILLY